MDKKQLLMIAAIGGVVTVVSVFLPWVTVDLSEFGPLAAAISSKVDTSVAGIEGGDGKIVLILGLVAAAAAGALFLGKKLPMSDKGAIMTAWICLGVAVLVALINLFDLKGPASAGIGMWLCILGGLAGAATGFLAWQKMGGKLPSAPSGDGGGDAAGGGGDGGAA